jgi:heme exporter protein B
MASKVGAILWKDILSEYRTKEMLGSMVVFSLLVSVIFNFAFPPGSELVREAAPGILWMTIIFASLLGLNRSFVYEVDKGCLQGLMLAPVDRNMIYISKALVNFIFITLVEVVVLPVFSIFFDLNVINSLLQILLVLILSTAGIAIIGTLFSAISVNTRSREIMLPIMYFPVFIPVIFGAVQSTKAILQEQAWSVIWGWLRIVIAFDVIFLVVALLTFEFVIEE